MKRRDIIKSGVGLGLFLPYFYLPTALANLLSFQQTRTLVAFIDALIPADITPSASQLKLHQTLLLYAKEIKNYPELIQLGCQWLDNQADLINQQPFLRLSVEQQNLIIKKAANSVELSIPAQFFSHIRQDLFRFYYANPASWSGLDISPPQPTGYLSYFRPLLNE
jgi:hypothetical protein